MPWFRHRFDLSALLTSFHIVDEVVVPYTEHAQEHAAVAFRSMRNVANHVLGFRGPVCLVVVVGNSRERDSGAGGGCDTS